MQLQLLHAIQLQQNQVATNKIQHGEELIKTSKYRIIVGSEEQRKVNQYYKLNLSFGFLVMEQFAKDAKHHPSNINTYH